MTADYPYNGRLSRWEEIAPGLAIVGVQALEDPSRSQASTPRSGWWESPASSSSGR